MKKLIKKIINKFGYDITKITIYNKDFLKASKWDSAIYHHLFSMESIENKRFYNIGAGSFCHPYWTNVDFYSKWYGGGNTINIHYNLMDLSPLPIEDNCAEIVYTSHTIEHVTNKAVENMFLEVYRILKKDGMFRITAPDAGIHYKIFKEKKYDFHYDRAYYSTLEEMKNIKINKPMLDATIGEIFLHFIATPLSPISTNSSRRKFKDKELEELFLELGLEKAFDYLCSFCGFDANNAGFHINWWTPNKIIDFLKKAGFSNIYLSSCGQSKSPIMWDLTRFDNVRPTTSFYVEAIK